MYMNILPVKFITLLHCLRRPEEGTESPELESQTLCVTDWVLQTEPASSARTGRK